METYEKMQMEIVEFDAEDVITASNLRTFETDNIDIYQNPKQK